MHTQSFYQKAIKFAAAKHAEQNQTVPGTNLPYVVHLSNVAMEIRKHPKSAVFLFHNQTPIFALKKVCSV